MKSIIWKDFIEYRWHLIIMMAFGLFALALLNHFRFLDSSTAIFLLFIFAGPPFALMMGMTLVEREVARDTFPFLAALPLQRSTIWWSKLWFGVLFISALYLFFLLISIAANASALAETDFTFYIKNFPKIPLAQIFFGLPAVFLSLGLFATMLPSIVSLIVMGFFSAGLVAILFTGFWYTINGLLVCSVLAGSFMFASRQAFIHGELMNSSKRVLWGIGGLIIGLTLSAGFWVGLDQLAEASYTLSPFDWSPVADMLVESESSVIFSPITRPSWFDPVQISSPHRIFRMNLMSGDLEQIGRRMTFTQRRSPDKRFLAANIDLWWFGAFGKSKLVLIDLFQQNKQTFVDEDSFSISFTKGGALIYERSITGTDHLIKEYAVYDPGSGSRILHSTSAPEFHRPTYLPEAESLLFVKRNSSGPPYLVDVKTGAVKKLALTPRQDVHPIGVGEAAPAKYTPYMLRYAGTLSSQSLLVNTLETTSAQFYTLDAEGRFEGQPWISSSAVVIHSLQDGRILALANQFSNKDQYQTEQADLIIIDGQTKTMQTLVHLEKLPSWGRTMTVDTQEKTMLVSLYDGNGFGIWSMNLLNGALKKLDFPFLAFRSAISNGPGKFITHENVSLWEIDLNRNEHRKIIDL